MKLSISNIAWSNEYDTEMYEYISKIGFSGIEIAPTKLFSTPYDNLTKAQNFLEDLKSKYNLEISSMQSIWFGKTQKIFSSDQERKELIKYTKKAIDFANIIKCNNLVFGCPKNRNINKTEDFEIAIEFFNKIGKYAEEKNTVFSIEPNPTIYNTNFINTTEEAFNIVKEINCNAIRVNVDLGTIINNNENLGIIEKNINLINHIHISEPNLELIKKRSIHSELKEILVKNNYSYYVSVEMKNQNNIEKVKKVMTYIKELFA